MEGEERPLPPALRPARPGEATPVVRGTGEEGLQCGACHPCPGPPRDRVRASGRCVAPDFGFGGHWGLGPISPRPLSWLIARGSPGLGPKGGESWPQQYKNRVKGSC